MQLSKLFSRIIQAFGSKYKELLADFKSFLHHSVYYIRNPLTGIKDAIGFAKRNAKYIFLFKEFKVSIVIAGAGNRTAFLLAYSTIIIQAELESYPNLCFLCCGVFISLSYFLLFLAFYHAIRACYWAFTSGSLVQKIVALFLMLMIFGYVLALLNYFLDLADYFQVEAASRTPNGPEKDLGTSKDCSERLPAMEKFRRGMFASKGVYHEKTTVPEQLMLGGYAAAAARKYHLAGNKKAAVLYGSVALAATALTTGNLLDSFTEKYNKASPEHYMEDSNLKK